MNTSFDFSSFRSLQQRLRNSAGILTAAALALAFAANAAHAATSANLPSAMQQVSTGYTGTKGDGMIHAYALFEDAIGITGVDYDGNNLNLKTLADWNTIIGTTTHAPTADKPWYTPVVANGGLISSQFAFVKSGDDLPYEATFLLQLTAISDGLTGFYYNTSGSGTFDAVFSTVGDELLWNGNMWHPYFVLDAAYAGQSVSASFTVTVVTGSTSTIVDYTGITYSDDLGLLTQNVTFNWTSAAVPEPAHMAALLGVGAVLAALWARRKNHYAA